MVEHEEWGTAVVVTHQAMRVVGTPMERYRTTSPVAGWVHNEDPYTVGRYHEARTAAERGRYIDASGLMGEPDPEGPWPGLPISGEDHPPKYPSAFTLEPEWPKHYDGDDQAEKRRNTYERGRIYVRFRRLPLPAPREGIVVGWRQRHEGERHPPRGNGMDDYEGGFLVVARRLWFYEVVLRSADTHALMVQVWHDDLRVAAPKS